jgi:DNA-directed RNA polymerase subunit M/transcription elongation factor TFIIS
MKTFCPVCNFSLSEGTLDFCPLCGSAMAHRPNNRTESVHVSLRFTVWDCDACGRQSQINPQRTCSHCGARIEDGSEVDRHITARVSAYATGVHRLQERVTGVVNPSFRTRGSRISPSDYLGWVSRNVIRPSADHLRKLDGLLGQTDWDDIDSPVTRQAWMDVQALCNESIDIVITASALVPPVFFLAYHRRIVRAVAVAANTNVGAISCLIAPTPEAAITLLRAHEESLSRVSGFAKALSLLLDCLLPILRGGSFDDSSDSPMPTLVDAFPELRVILRSDPAMVEPFSRQRLLAYLLHDPDRRSERVDQSLAVLRSAYARQPGWIREPATFTDVVVGSWRQLCAQHKRVEMDLSTEHAAVVMDGVLDVASKVAEGPYRRCGSILVLAARVAGGKNCALDGDSLFQVRRLSLVHRELGVAAPALTRDVDPLLRNAEAHYDYEVSSELVRIRHLPPNATSTSDALIEELSHDDVIEQVINLLEATQAILLALLIYVWTDADHKLRESLRWAWLGLR